jgi:hypothetical protein
VLQRETKGIRIMRLLFCKVVVPLYILTPGLPISAVYLYGASARMTAASSGSHLSPLDKSFSVKYMSAHSIKSSITG